MNKIILVLMSVVLLSTNVFAEGAGGASAFGGLMPLLIIFVFFYLFLIRPQQKQRKQHQKMLDALQRDDKIITAGGIYATVVSVNADVAEVKIAENVRIKIVKSTITTVVMPEVAVTPEVIK
jgi:preprotein translocase subunit YajC